MKFNLLSAALASAAVRGVLSATLPPRDDIHEVKVEALEPAHFKELGAKRVRIKYGPYVVPSVDDPEFAGMKDYDTTNIQMPCTDCFITGFLGSLELLDGTVANANTGMWLHHVVFININRTDTTCPKYPDRFMASGNERTPLDLTAGGTHKAGYYLKKDDIVWAQVELMNESQDERQAYMTAEWEFVPGSTEGFDVAQSLWLDVDGPCGDSSVEVSHGEKTFSLAMNDTFSPNFTATVLMTMGHLHDGGVAQEIFDNGKVICNHTANYGESAGFVTHVGLYGHEKDKKEHEHEHEEEHEHEHEEEHEHEHEEEHEHTHEETPHEHTHEEPPHEHEHPHEHGRRHPPGEPHEEEGEPGSEHDHNSDEHILHISSFTQCPALGKIGPETKLSIKAHYDMTEHVGMEGHHGDLEPVMGIEIMFVQRPKEEAMKEIMTAVGPEWPPHRPEEEKEEEEEA